MRTFLLILLSGLLSSAAQGQTSSLERQIRLFAESRKAQVGVAVIINGKDTLTVNNSSYYPMMSVFKLHQALAVTDWLENNGLALDSLVTIAPAELLPNTYSPLRDRHPKGNISLSYAELMKYTLQLSDNNACDILFRRTGGPKATDKYIRGLGLNDFSLSETEESMHQDLERCYLNRTSPLDATRLLEFLLTRPLFSEKSQAFIRQTLIECQTGTDRLAHPLKGKNVKIGHKTGTGDRNASGQFIGTNDIGFVLLPDGTRYTIAVFVKDSEESPADTAYIIARISQMVYRFVCAAS